MISILQALHLIDSKKENETISRYQDVDWILVVVVAILLLFGLLMVFSSTVGAINSDFSQAANFRYFYMQIAFVLIGLLAMNLVYMIPFGFWQKYNKLLMLFGFLLLVLVLLPGIGKEVNGSKRWIPLGPVNMQPSELVKMFVILYIAGYVCRTADMMKDLKLGIAIPGVVVLLVTFLLMLEPDFGTTVVVLVSAGSMLFLGGIRMLHALVILSVCLVMVTVLAFSSEYRVERLMSFTNPWSDPFDKGFQLVQALIAIGRGEWFGVGLGNSVQKLFYLPHAHNDFILAVIGEEMGFIGIISLIGLYVTFVWRLFDLSEKAEKVSLYFGSKVCQGIAILVGFQAFINMGVNLGALPTKGITLPFLSYGGSSIIVICMQVGLVFAVQKEVNRLNRIKQSAKKVREDSMKGNTYV